MDPESARRFSFIPGGSPLQVARAEGAYLITPDGRRILDAGGGAIVTSIGHGRDEVAQVAAEALRNLTYAAPPFVTPERLRLVDRLRKSWLPEPLTRVTFVSGGSESVEVAIRLARQHHVCAGRPGRWKVIGTDLSYHGATLAALAVGGHAGRRRNLEPLLIPFPKTPAPYSLAGALGRVVDDPRLRAVDEFEKVVEREGPETIAAFIAEPMVGAAGGADVPPPDFWPGIAEVCRRHGILVIADEVMTGFGRTGKRFGIEHWNVVPDIMVGGKGLSGGYAPIGGVYATEEVVAPLAAAGEELMFFTYDGHPPSCAIADKVLEIMEREALVERSARVGALLKARLEEEFNDHPNVAQVRGLGLLLGLELVRDRDRLEKFPPSARVGALVTATGLERGAWLYPGGSGRAHDVVMLGPPLIIESADVDLLVGVLRDAIDVAVAKAEKASPA